MKAIWNNKTIAESDATIEIEGNHYFPPESIHTKYFQKSNQETTCHWKGTAHYYDVVVDGKKNKNAAWYYPEPLTGSEKTAGGPFANYVAFWNGIDIRE